MRDRTFDSCTYDVDGGGGGGGGGTGVEATGFSGGGGAGNNSSPSVELQQPSEEEEQLSVLPDSREFGCVPLCSAICARPRNCCPSLENQKRTEGLHNGFLSRQFDGEEGRGDSDEVPTLRDSDQAVQRVLKVSDGEIQLQVIGSELSCVKEEKPQKRKKKFIIILKGLLNKSNKSDRKKQQSENSVDCRGNCSEGNSQSKPEDERKNNCLEKNKSESNLSKIKDCCLTRDKANSYKSENNISLGKCKDFDSDRKCLASSNNSISSSNYYRSHINTSYNRRKFTGTTVDTQEQLTLLYYAALTGSSYKENGEKGAICQDVVGGVSRSKQEEEAEERVPQPADTRPTRDVIPEDNLKKDSEDSEVERFSGKDSLSTSSSDSSRFSRKSIEQEEELVQSDFTEHEPSLCSRTVESEDSEGNVSCLSESDAQIHCDSRNSNSICDLDQESSCDIDCDSLPDSHQEKSDTSLYCSNDSNIESNKNADYEPINVKNITICDTKDRSVSEPILNGCNKTFSSSFSVTRLESKSVCLENKFSQSSHEINEDEIDPWATGTSCDFSSESDDSDSSSDSSVDVPPVDDYIYDLQFDPYFYQGSLSLENVPDDQPIDYPCPYDSDGRLIRNQVPEYNTHFPYIDHHSYNPITNLGDIYRTQSQPEDISHRIYENTPLDGNAPLHVFLSQPIPNQVPYNFPSRNCQLKPRKRGEFSSLCSFGGSQLYTITEEAEWDPLEEDIYSRRQYSDGEFYTRRNYSESDIYLGYDDGYCGEPYYMNPDLYYGDTDTESDSDETIHSESSHCDSTETLDKDEYSVDLGSQIIEEQIEAETYNQDRCDEEYCNESGPAQATSTDQLSDCNDTSSYQEAFAEPDSEAVTDVIEICHEDFAIGGKEQGLTYHEEDAAGACHSEYPDEFFLFCSEAEITDMEVMDTVEVLPYNGSKEDFNYFKVEDKRSDSSSPIDQDYLMDGYNYSSKSNITKNHFWDHSKDNLDKMSSTPIYQNIPINSRLSKSNPNLAALSEDNAPAKPVYQNVPVPSKRYHVPVKGQSFTTESVFYNSDDDLDYISHNREQYTSYTSNRGSSTKQTFHRSDSHEPCTKLSSKDDNDVQMSLHKWSSNNWRNGDLSSIGSSSTPSGMNQGWQDLSVAGITPAEFNAYASNTSLDHDAFSKTSKIYKWNGSSSVSDLTSLSRDLSSTSSGVAKTSASTSDLTTIGGGGGSGGRGHESYSDDENFQELLSETSYAAWSAKVHNDLDDQDFVLPLNMKNTSSFSFASHGKSGNRAMMEFYVNNLTSDDDSDNDSSAGSSTTSASGGSHDLEEEEQQHQMLDRTYQVIGGADTVLDTIEEDVEEDSGAESSGHWMFSADNTDTDSVIHVPAILDLRPYSVEAVKEAESTDSDGTLVIEEDIPDRVCYTEVASNLRQEAGVTEGNSHVEAPTNDRHHLLQGAPQGESDASEEEGSDLGSSRGVEPVTVGGGDDGSPSSDASFHTSRGNSKDNTQGGNAGDSKGRDIPHQDKKTMLSRSEATRLFEKRIDDVFDFESLESCESVYGGNDNTGYSMQGCASPLGVEEVVFNTSATSQPFADASGELSDLMLSNRKIDSDTVLSKELSPKNTHGDGRLPTTPTSHGVTPFESKQDDALQQNRSDSSFSELNNSVNGGQCNLDQTFIIGKSDNCVINENTNVTDINEFTVLESTLIENEEKHSEKTKDGEPLSMDLFGLPVRWTEGGKTGSPGDLTCTETTVAALTCLSQEVGQSEQILIDKIEKNSEDDLKHRGGGVECSEVKYDSDSKYDKTCDEEIRSLTESIVKEGGRSNGDHDASENEIATQSEHVSVALSEGDFTFASFSSPCLRGSETAAVEARHYQTATGNLLKSSTDPQQLSVIVSAEGEGGGSPLLSDRNGTVDSATVMREINAYSARAVETRNDTRQTVGGQPQHVKSTRQIENLSNYEGENKDARCHQIIGDYDNQQHQYRHANVHRDVKNGQPLGGDLPSGDSDADTDNTDGDYDEEDHFAAELSLRISTVHPEVKGRGGDCATFRNSDIISALTSCRGEKREEEDGVGHEDAPGSVSPLASQDGSSPEMPDSLRSSEGRSATRSMETLSEDSGLGDRDVRLTPSSPLPAISEGATRGVEGVPLVSPSSSSSLRAQQPTLTSVTARPKRQDIRQARIARARSCGDLRAYSASSDTDTEEEDDNMRGWHSRFRGREPGANVSADDSVHNGGMHYDKPFKSSYANYLQQQYQGQGVDDRSNSNNIGSQPPPPSSHHQHHHIQRSHPVPGSNGIDGEVKSRYRRVRDASNNHSRPRRYNSLLEFPWRDSSNNASEYFYKDPERVPRGSHSHSRPSRRRPQPISVDLAEEFLSQEREGTTNSKPSDQNNVGTIRISDNKLTVNNNTPSATCPMPSTNQIAHGELKTNGVEVGGALPPRSHGSWGEEGLAEHKDEVRADVRVQCGWPHASADSVASPTAPYPHHHHHHPLDALHHQQLSCTPPMPNHTPLAPSQRQTHHQYSSSSSSSAQLPNECQPVRTNHSGDIESHDPLAQCDPSAFASSNQQQQLQQQQQPSFVVSSKSSDVQIQRSEGEEVMEEVPITRVRTKTYGSHGEVEVYLARADSGRPPPHPGAPVQPVLTPTGGLENRTGSRGVTFSPSVKEVNWRESYYDVEPEGEDVCDSVKSNENKGKEKETLLESPVISITQQQQEVVPPSQVPSVPIVQPSNVHVNNKLNGGALEPSTGSSSEAEGHDEGGQQQKTPSGPIWQRFKLPKITSPKSPRPKIMPKPKNLSPRSSDAENSKPATPTPHESGSSTPSSPDSKLKKAPPSPKFFTWGSKREKKPREITRPKTPPPPVPHSSPPPPSSAPPPPQPTQVSSGQAAGGQGGETGKLDSSSSVTLTGFNREGRSDASPVIISAKKREVVASESNRGNAKIAPALLIAKRQQLRKSEPVTSASSYSSSSARDEHREEEGPERRSLSVSSSGEDSADARGTSPTPRSAVAKPPLPPHLQRPTQQAFHKARLISARRHYFSQERQTSAPERVSPPKDNKDTTDAPHSAVSVAARPPVTPPPTPPVSKYRQSSVTSSSSSSSSSAARGALLTKGNFDSSKNLKERFERFSTSTRAERERLARSTPDLSVLIESVRRPNRRIDSCTGGGAETAAAEDFHVAASQASASDGETSNHAHAHQGASHTQSKPRQAIHERYKNRAQRIYARTRTQSTGVLETDLDTGASRELLTLRETNLDDLYKDLQHLLDSIPSVGAPTPTESKARAKSLLDLEAAGSAMEGQLEAPARPPDTRAKSMEFLLDDGNKAAVQPPENELMKGSERQLSEAELRVRRSLQRLDVPEWMKNAQPQQTGFLLRRRDYGSSSGGGGWSAYSSKTASMTSLGSSRAHTPNTPTKVVIPTRVASKGTSGIGGVTSPASNASISPSPSDRSGSLFQYPISRWSTSRLNSGTTTPTGSVTSTRTTPPTYVRQPYLGWRSQTSLASLAGSQSSLTNTGSYLTAADRLALGITSYSQRFVKPSVSAQDKENSSAQANAVVTKSDNEEMNEDASTNGSVKLQVPTDVADVHSSIKEVTSAIVHYCNESTPSPRASPRGSPRPEGPRAPSPRRLVWVESSFVGSRPITSPETPTSSTHAITPTSQLNGHEEPESNEAPSQPPQPPGEYLLAW